MRIQTPSSPAIAFGNYFQMNVPFGGYSPSFKGQTPVFKGQSPVFGASIRPNDGGCIKYAKSCQPIKLQAPGEEIKEGQKLNALV